MSIPSTVLSPQEWASLYRRDDGEQQPISPVERVFGSESHGRRHGLELIRQLLERRGDPHLQYPTIHVGGSKGKGSTVAILVSILRAAGYRVGAYTSPSLTHFGERIQVDGRPITDAEAEVYIEAMQPCLAELPDRPRFFEASTAIAFEHFARSNVDVAVIEVGLGGRLDATNVVSPELCLITSIELEHTQVLGDTLAEIAWEKAGIVKPGVPTVTAVDQPEAIEPIERACAERNSTLWHLVEHSSVTRVRSEPTRQIIDLELGPGLGGQSWTDLVLGLAGEAQSINGALAVAAASLLAGRFGRISPSTVRQGLSEARWPGRLELIAGQPRVLLDVAHTPASARQLRRYLERHFAGTPKQLVIGLLRDKKVQEIAGELAPLFDQVLVAPVKWFRAMDGETLQRAFDPHAVLVEQAGSICAATERALENTPPDGLVVVAGSLFAVGEAKRRFGWCP